MKEKLYELIVEEKKVPFKDLIDQHFSLPVDRVSRFLDMLNDEYTTGESNQLKQFFLSELNFAQEKISRRELFQATPFESATAFDKESKITKQATNILGAIKKDIKGRMSMRLPWMD